MNDFGLSLGGLSKGAVLECIVINLFYILVGFQVVMMDEVEDMLKYPREIRQVCLIMLMG